MHLKAALNYTVFKTAAGGAVVGLTIGGPIGFLAGAKIGAACGLGSGVIGYFLAKRLKNTE